MYEIFPLLAGVVAALAARRLVAPRMRLALLIGYSAVFGLVASVVSGEFFVSWIFLAVDTALVLLSACATASLLGWRRQGSERFL